MEMRRNPGKSPEARFENKIDRIWAIRKEQITGRAAMNGRWKSSFASFPFSSQAISRSVERIEGTKECVVAGQSNAI